jgi:putative component of membrane protein insertase Oxa1/YidC/SpoIIIJ protein YidD
VVTRAVAAAAGGLVILWFFGQPLAIGGIHLHQRLLAPVMTRAGLECRFIPSCSHYAEVVIARDGLPLGGIKTLARIVRCAPWTPMGTLDHP